MPQVETPSARLRAMLDRPGPVVVPCAFDCVSARIVEQAGFPAVMHGGFNTAASLLGIPDVGIITMTEMLTAARHMAEAVEIPVIADVDDGFGQPLNVARTTTEAIRAGLAGMYMEDQLSPKRCPSLGGGQVVPVEQMAAKLRMARKMCDQHDPSFVIIARTHASLAIGLDEAIRRGRIYAQHGADLVWVDLGYDEKVVQELESLAASLGPHMHLVANMVENVGRPMLTTAQLFHMGFKLITYPLTLILTAAEAMTRVMRELSEKGTTAALADQMMPVTRFEPIVRMNAIREMEIGFERH